MAALTAARNTPRKVRADDCIEEYPVAAAVKIYQGSIVMIDAGFAKPGATATAKFPVGRARKTYDNTSGSNGTIKCEVETGVFQYVNNASDITAAMVGGICYLVDDQTVSSVSTGKSVAGIVMAVDSGGVWVKLQNGMRQT